MTKKKNASVVTAKEQQSLVDSHEYKTCRSKLENLDTPFGKALLDSMPPESVIATAKALIDTEEKLSDKAKAKKHRQFRTQKVDCKPVKDAVEKLVTDSLDWIESSIDASPDWSRGGSLALDNDDRITYGIKVVNPDADDKELQRQRELKSEFIGKQKEIVENIGLKPLREYLFWLLKDKETTSLTVFDKPIKVGKYLVNLSLGYNLKKESE